MTAHHAAEPDDRLRQAFHRGEPDAVEALAERFHDDVFRFCHAILGSDDDAAEAAAETFLRLMERHRLYDPARPLRPWLFTICRRCCANVARRTGRHGARIVSIDEDGLSGIPDGRDGTRLVDDLHRAELQTLVGEAIARLAPNLQAVVVLHIFEELTFREIAGVLEMPQATAATLYYRAVGRLRDELVARPAGRSTNHG